MYSPVLLYIEINFKQITWNIMFIGHEQLMILVIDILKNQQERILAGEFIVFRGKIPGSGIGAAAIKMMAFIIAGMFQEFKKLLLII